jgi:hypothetical protein
MFKVISKTDGLLRRRGCASGLANDHAPTEMSGGADALPLFCIVLRGVI